MDELPGGYWDSDGRLHRGFELVPLTGRDEESLAGAIGARPATFVTEVLSRCVGRIGAISPVSAQVARELLVGDRQYLLLRLRAATFGERVRAHLICPWPDCGKPASLDFSIADVPVTSVAERAPRHTMTVSDNSEPLEIEFRLPNGADQEAVSGLLGTNEAAALTALLARCVVRIGSRTPPDEQQIAALSPRARFAIEERMAALAPRVDQTMHTACPECHRTFVAPFDIQHFFFGEFRTDNDTLYREVHYLAYHYHWSEHEIMGLTRDKRHRYIDVLAGALEEYDDGG
ncbi:DUF6760 family protein [Nocardia sp. NPDC050710]|uniref:T4 family baseplate hub assembly chaperone n=1 Tax=Nocardia sp. NPDC050710 TaxID=3157220 RepID=UPI0033F892A2